MPAALRQFLAPLAVMLLAVWLVSVAGATGWSVTVNWALAVSAIVLLAARRFA